MPFAINKRDGKFVVVKAGGKVMGTHDDEEKAKRQLAALNISENKSVKVAFEPFEFVNGQPIRLLPEGTWYRGDRTLEITPTLLEQVEKNFNDGLPRYRVGFNLNHEENQGKVGNINKVKYITDGEKPGVYATEYDLTPKGLDAISEDGYDGISAEMVWSIHEGNTYQDPESGDEFDNVLVGVAFTPHPFFGHAEMELYSATPGESETQTLFDKFMNVIKESAQEIFGMKQEEQLREFTAEQRHEMAKKGQALPDGSFPIVTVDDLRNAIQAIGRAKSRSLAIRHIKKRASALGATDLLPETFIKEVQMADEEKTLEELEAELLEARTQNEELQGELATAQEELSAQEPDTEEFVSKSDYEDLRADHEELKSERQAELLSAEVDAFNALPMDRESYIENMVILDPKSATWVREQFAAADSVLVEAGLMGEIGTELGSNRATDLDSLTQSILNEKFDGDASKYAEALEVAMVEHESKIEASYGRGGR